jgi:hypothetical protein
LKNKPARAVPSQADSAAREILPEDRPQICFVSWGPVPDDHDVPLRVGQTGFHLVNDGIAAHEISVGSFETEPGVWAVSATIARIREKGDGFAFVWRGGFSGFAFDTGKWDLQGSMAAAAAKRPASMICQTDYRVRVGVIYRDGSSAWYRSRADLIYIPTQNRLTFGPTTHERAEVPPTSLAISPRPGDDGKGGETEVRNGGRRGPPRDFVTALRVEEVVRRLAPEGNWREKSEDICEGLDEARIRFPKTWKAKGHRTWYDCLMAERGLAIKAIGHHLERARERRQTIS